MKDHTVTGQIFDIQHYCVHDGPGIRTDVFFKGCPLRCQWCSNPESHSVSRQLLFREELCVGCGACAQACTQRAIRLTPQGAWTDLTRCNLCGACETACRHRARSIAGREATAGEVVDEVMRDALFYGKEGGVTLTGGECTMQPDFARSILRLSKARGITTCIETCGYVAWQELQSIAALTDTILYDVKAVNADAHFRFTGVRNELILENLSRLSDQTACRLIVRVPIVPGCNAGDAMIKDLGRFLGEQVRRCKEVELLPYHNLGEGKYDQLGIVDRTFSAEAPSESEMDRYRTLLRAYVPIVK